MARNCMLAGYFLSLGSIPAIFRPVNKYTFEDKGCIRLYARADRRPGGYEFSAWHHKGVLEGLCM